MPGDTYTYTRCAPCTADECCTREPPRRNPGDAPSPSPTHPPPAALHHSLWSTTPSSDRAKEASPSGRHGLSTTCAAATAAARRRRAVPVTFSRRAARCARVQCCQPPAPPAQTQTHLCDALLALALAHVNALRGCVRHHVPAHGLLGVCHKRHAARRVRHHLRHTQHTQTEADAGLASQGTGLQGVLRGAHNRNSTPHARERHAQTAGGVCA
jgi:hypothetical protein